MSMNRPRHRRILPALLASVFVVTGCTGLPMGADFNRLTDTELKERSFDARRSMKHAVNFFAEKPVTVLEINDENAFTLATDPGQEVPRVVIGEINAAPMKFGTLLNQVAAQASMNWRIEGPGKKNLMDEEIYFVQRSETMLEKVLDELSRLTSSFYKVEGDRIIFSRDRLFVARVPRMANSQEILTDGLSSLGATDIFTDKFSGTITFRATRPVFEGARRLMRSLEQGRDMIVYDLWIIDRTVSDRKAVGVSADFTESTGSWEESLGVSGQQVVESILDGGSDTGLISGNFGDIGVDVTMNFLRALGEAETLARPTISMLSGGESRFTSGQTREYIREISSSTSESGDSTSSGTDVETLETGIKINVEGAHSAGVISSEFEIEIDEFIEFEEFDTGEVTLKLPRTTERKMDAHIEARPGDVMVLGGIMREREDDASREVVLTGVPLSSGRAAEKTETIILVRPRLVQIRPVKGAARPASTRIGGSVTDITPPAGNAIGGVIEDEHKAVDLLRGVLGESSSSGVRK